MTPQFCQTSTTLNSPQFSLPQLPGDCLKGSAKGDGAERPLKAMGEAPPKGRSRSGGFRIATPVTLLSQTHVSPQPRSSSHNPTTTIHQPRPATATTRHLHNPRPADPPQPAATVTRRIA
jgi:hypothetical protein